MFQNILKSYFFNLITLISPCDNDVQVQGLILSEVVQELILKDLRYSAQNLPQNMFF